MAAAIAIQSEGICYNLCEKSREEIGVLQHCNGRGNRECSATYCSQECQKAHWFMHRHVCAASRDGVPYPALNVEALPFDFCMASDCIKPAEKTIQCVCSYFSYC